jgi:hypothetical protein
VFISHTGQDPAAKTFAASILKPALEAAGLSVFMDFSNLPPGCEWPAALVDAAAHSAVVVAVLSRSYVRRFWCMYELDMALHGIQGQSRAGKPLIIPVFYDSPSAILQPQEQAEPVETDANSISLQQLWQDYLIRSTAVAADRQQYVLPERWAENFAAMRQQLQNLRLSNFPQAKDRDYQLARQVVTAALPAVDPPQAVPDGLVGYQQQEARLLAGLAVPDPQQSKMGLWLHGIGEATCFDGVDQAAVRQSA